MGVDEQVKELVDRSRLLIRGALVRVQHGLLHIKSLSQKYQPGVQKYQLLKDQLAKAGRAGFLFASTLRRRDYNPVTDDADETPLLAGPLTLRDTIVPNNANETRILSLAAHQRCRNCWEVSYGR